MLALLRCVPASIAYHTRFQWIAVSIDLEVVDSVLAAAPRALDE